MPTAEVSMVTKIIEIGKEVGTPVGVLFIMIIMWQFLVVFKELAYFGIEIGKKFMERHFQHIDTLEKNLQDTAKTNSADMDKVVQTLSTVNSSVSALTANMAQNNQKLKPLSTTVTKLEQAITHCQNQGRD